MLMIEAHKAFTELAPTSDDTVMMNEDWSIYTDALTKDGQLTALQYHYCPAYDDTFPEDIDEERDFMLDAMGVQMAWKRTDETPKHLQTVWANDAFKFIVTITRGNESMVFPFMMGKGTNGVPTRDDVLYCLKSDRDIVEMVEGDFHQYCEDMDANADSITDLTIFNAMKENSATLEGMFTAEELEELDRLFEDF